MAEIRMDMIVIDAGQVCGSGNPYQIKDKPDQSGFESHPVYWDTVPLEWMELRQRRPPGHQLGKEHVKWHR